MACIRKRRERWVLDYYDQRGIRRWKTMKEGTTKKKARQKLAEIEKQIEHGTYRPDRQMPTFANVGQDWLEHKKANIRESTWDMYARILRLHFEEINQIKIDRITIATVEKFATKRQTAGMNLSTLRKLLVTFNQVMAFAVRRRYIDYNPVRDAERPRRQGNDEPEGFAILSPDEISRFLDAEKDPEYKMLFMLAAMSGARQGELLGLKWSEVDWENNQIRIRRTFNSGKWYSPKSQASKRDIDLGPMVMKELKKWRLGCPPSDLDLVFPSDDGQLIERTYLLKEKFYPALTAAEVKHVRFHDLRHTFASLLLSNGENVKYVQKQMGHASPTVTLNIYAHLMEEVNQAAACRLEATVFSSVGL